MQSEIVLKASTQRQLQCQHKRKKRSKVGLFSLILLTCLAYGVWQWHNSLKIYLAKHPASKLDHFALSQIIELDNSHSFEQSILKYKIYLLFTCGYVQPNIVLAVCILMTFAFTINSLEVETCTPVAFFEYNGNSIYLQIIRMGLDGVQYFLTGRCYCLNSGAGAVWLNLLTKAVFNRGAASLSKRPWTALAVSITYLVGGFMFVQKGRLDLLIGVMMGFVEVHLMGGGSIKYPKQNFQEKERFAQRIRLGRLSLWQPFIWNQYKQNQCMTLDSNQYYVGREQRLEMGRFSHA